MVIIRIHGRGTQRRIEILGIGDAGYIIKSQGGWVSTTNDLELETPQAPYRFYRRMDAAAFATATNFVNTITQDVDGFEVKLFSTLTGNIGLTVEGQQIPTGDITVTYSDATSFFSFSQNGNASGRNFKTCKAAVREATRAYLATI